MDPRVMPLEECAERRDISVANVAHQRLVRRLVHARGSHVFSIDVYQTE
jgi:hypothetical protein